MKPEHLTGSTDILRAAADFYRTPEHATISLLEREHFYGRVWEPACGDGAISRVFKQWHSTGILSTDLHDYGYGEVFDFLGDAHKLCDNIVTNPPYSLAQPFIERALQSSKYKVAMLLKLNFLEGQKRAAFFRQSPPSRVYVFSRRLSFDRGDVKNKGRGLLAYAWYVWDKSYNGEPMIRWI